MLKRWGTLCWPFGTDACGHGRAMLLDAASPLLVSLADLRRRLSGLWPALPAKDCKSGRTCGRTFEEDSLEETAAVVKTDTFLQRDSSACLCLQPESIPEMHLL